MRIRALIVLVVAISCPLAWATERGTEAHAYHLVVEVIDADGSHLEATYPVVFETIEEAFEQARRFHRSGFCFSLPDPPIPDPYLVGVCYPSEKIVRTRVLFF